MQLPRLTPLRPKDWIHERFLKKGIHQDAYDRRWEPRAALMPTLEHPISQPCSANQIYLPRFRQWTDEMNQPYLVHRKQWEWVYILQALENAGRLQKGQHGLGFGVGTEPIPAVAAKRGAEILATDGDVDHAEEGGWTTTNQHADDIGALNNNGICDEHIFVERVKFRTVDMRNVPKDLNGFDFTWSACALEHLGSLDAGFDFVCDSLRCLKPGGTAVHTTEYNVSSNEKTLDSGGTVLYRRRDLERFARDLRSAGHKIRLTFGLGTTDDDRHIDEKPYSNCHLKVRFEDYVITSFGMIVTKSTGG